jgi:hypothetical protein
MIVLAAIALTVAAVPLTGGSLGTLAHLRLRFVWLIWVCLIAQVASGVIAAEMESAEVAAWLHLATFAPAGVFIWANRRLPGAIVMAVGGGMNLLAITANGGVMPARPAAWSGAGLPDVSGEWYANSMPVSDATLWFLGDVFYIPAGWPLANVFSVGDVLLVVGAGYLTHRWCRRTDVIDQQRQPVIDDSSPWPPPTTPRLGGPIAATRADDQLVSSTH